MGCSLDTVGSIEPFYMADPETSPVIDAVIYYPNNIKISATDAPLENKNLEKVRIKFHKMEVSMGDVDDENAEWIPINEVGGEFNLLELTNGTCQTLAMAQLGLGKYRQTRFQISEAVVEEDMKEHPVHLDKKTITIGREFLVEEGLMTNLVLDFDAQRSLQKVEDRWIMAPVIRFVERYNTGAIVGQVVLPADLEEHVVDPVVDPVEDPVEDPIEDPLVDPVEDPVEDPVVDPCEDPVEDPIEDPLVDPVEDPVEEQCEEPLKATVTAYKDGVDESYSSTIAGESGIFILGYLETGRYDIVIKAGAEDEYFLEVNDVDVVIGEVVKLGQLELTLKEEEPPIINTITVDVVNTINPSINGSKVHITTFTDGKNISNGMIETVTKDFDGVSIEVNMDNLGAGYQDGTYGIMVNIDYGPPDGILTAEDDRDFVAVGEVTVSGGSASVEINGPWGTYFTTRVVSGTSSTLNDFMNNNPDTIDKTMYLTLVSAGETWGTYSYGELAHTEPGYPPLGIIPIDCWAPDSTYELLAFIDMNDTKELDAGDWWASQVVNVVEGEPVANPAWNMTIDSWPIRQ
jgi:hypothetical protein